MFIATVAVSLLLAVLLVASAVIKLTRREPYVQGYLAVGVPENRLPHLAALLLAGAAGVLLGLWWAALGIAAAIGLLCYFLLAIVAHMRADDVRNLPMPTVFAGVAAVTLALRVATA